MRLSGVFPAVSKLANAEWWQEKRRVAKGMENGTVSEMDFKKNVRQIPSVPLSLGGVRGEGMWRGANGGVGRDGRDFTCG